MIGTIRMMLMIHRQMIVCCIYLSSGFIIKTHSIFSAPLIEIFRVACIKFLEAHEITMLSISSLPITKSIKQDEKMPGIMQMKGKYVLGRITLKKNSDPNT